jgi:hypothetical protein
LGKLSTVQFFQEMQAAWEMEIREKNRKGRILGDEMIIEKNRSLMGGT